MRRAEQKYLIEGIRLCEEALKSSDTLEQLIFCRESIARNSRLENLYQGDSRTTHPHPANRLARLQTHVRHRHTARRTWRSINADLGSQSHPQYPWSPFSSSTASPTPATWASSCEQPRAAGCKGIFLTRGSVEVYNPKVVRATMGAIFRMPVFPLQDGPALLHQLRQRNIQIIAAHTNGISFHNLQTQKTRCPPPRQRSLWHRSRPPRPIRSHRHHTHGRPGRIPQHRSRKRHSALSN